MLTVPYGSGRLLFHKDSKGLYSTELEYSWDRWQMLKEMLKMNIRQESCCVISGGRIKEVPPETEFAAGDDREKAVLCVCLEKP